MAALLRPARRGRPRPRQRCGRAHYRRCASAGPKAGLWTCPPRGPDAGRCRRKSWWAIAFRHVLSCSETCPPRRRSGCAHPGGRPNVEVEACEVGRHRLGRRIASIKSATVRECDPQHGSVGGRCRGYERLRRLTVEVAAEELKVRGDLNEDRSVQLRRRIAATRCGTTKPGVSREELIETVSARALPRMERLRSHRRPRVCLRCEGLSRKGPLVAGPRNGWFTDGRAS